MAGHHPDIHGKAGSDAQEPMSDRHDESDGPVVHCNPDDDVFVDKSVEDAAVGEERISTDSGADEDAALAQPGREIDPQAIYPQTACLFVGNLPNSYSDAELKTELTNVFGQFGEVFVKIKHKDGQMPYGFAQFTDEKDAAAAMDGQSNLFVFNRLCRCELSSGGWQYYIFRKTRSPIEYEEALMALRRFGEVSIELVDARTQSMHQFPKAYKVKFSNYDTNRDLERAFDKDPYYQVVSTTSKALKGLHESRRVDFGERDKRTAFFGNLPETMDQDGILRLVRSCGRVMNITHKTKSASYGSSKRYFAYVEFATEEGAMEAARSLNRRFTDGHHLQVERKHIKVPGMGDALVRRGDGEVSRLLPRAPRAMMAQYPSSGANNRTSDAEARRDSRPVAFRAVLSPDAPEFVPAHSSTPDAHDATPSIGVSPQTNSTVPAVTSKDSSRFPTPCDDNPTFEESAPPASQGHTEQRHGREHPVQETARSAGFTPCPPTAPPMGLPLVHSIAPTMYHAGSMIPAPCLMWLPGSGYISYAPILTDADGELVLSTPAVEEIHAIQRSLHNYQSSGGHLGQQPYFSGSQPFFPGQQPNVHGHPPSIPPMQPFYPGPLPNFPSSQPVFPGSQQQYYY